jgi:hypothetical protein
MASASWGPEKCVRGVCVAPSVRVEMRCACAYIPVGEGRRKTCQAGLVGGGRICAARYLLPPSPLKGPLCYAEGLF